MIQPYKGVNTVKLMNEHAVGDRIWQRLSFGSEIDLIIVIFMMVLVILAVWWLYRLSKVDISRPIRVLLIILKSAALTSLFICILKPQIIIPNKLPRESHLAILVDGSSSMALHDNGKELSRGEAAIEMMYGENGLVNRLGERLKVHTFSFDSGFNLISNPGELVFTGSRTDINQGLQHAENALEEVPLSGIVLISDGGDNTGEDPVHMARLLNSKKIPVFAVGVGQKKIEKDLEITRLTASQSVLQDSIFDVSVTVRNQGYGEDDIELVIEQEDRIVSTQRFKVENGISTKRHTFELMPEKEGPLVYTVRIPEESDEIVTENNKQTFLVNNEKRRLNILYVEGYPRNEYKFIRRAVQDDKDLRIAAYLKTGPQKYLRQGMDSPEELDKGYPVEEEELFRYEAIIIGDVPRGFFTTEQLAITKEFVSKRGGGLLMIGGKNGFSDGFIDTPIADLLPITLIREDKVPMQLRGSPQSKDHPTGQKFTLRLTMEGERSPLLRLKGETEMNLRFWESMPQLQGINVTGPAKPGAVVLAVHPFLNYQNRSLPVIAYERYGRGRTMAITTSSTWRWQMLMAHEDTSHERFWRQLLRWLAGSALHRVEINLDRDSYVAGDEVLVSVRISDRSFSPVNDATVWLKVTGPDNTIQDIRLAWSVKEEGVYRGAFNVHKNGVYNLGVSSTSASGAIDEADISLFAGGYNMEYTNPAMNAALLMKIAEESGGKFYTEGDISQLVNDIWYLPQDYTVLIREDIWDSPIMFFLIVLFFSLEWFIRRRKGVS